MQNFVNSSLASFGLQNNQDEDKLNGVAPVVKNNMQQFMNNPIETEVRPALEKTREPFSPSTKYSWINKKQEKYIEDNGKNDSEKEDIYANVIRAKEDNIFLKDRDQTRQLMIQKFVKSKDPAEKNTLLQTIKLGQLGDEMRKAAFNKGIFGVKDKSDEDLLNALGIWTDTKKQTALSDFFNNKIDAPTALNRMWLQEIQATQKEQEKVDWTVLWDITGWIAKSWTASAEIWSNIGDWIGYNATKAIRGKEKADEIKAKMWGSYGETIDKTLTGLWVDQDSFAYNAGKFAGDTAQIAAWGAALKTIPAVAKWIQAVDAVGKTSKWMQIGTSIAKWAIQWATDTAMYDAIANKELVSGKELAIWGAIGGVIGGISWAVKVKQAGKITKAKESVDKAVWQIIQWDAKHIEKAKTALLSVDTKWVKDYKWLSQVIWSKKVAVMESLDDVLATNTNVFTPKDTTIISKVGTNWVKTSTNHVWKMIDDLVEYYTRNADDYSRALVEDAKITYQKWWLSVAKINNLAKEYGIVSKAFTKTWDPLTSVTKQAFENTRRWVKAFIRSQFDNDAAKLLDQSYSQLETTQMLVDNMAKKVNSLQQKVMDKWFIEKVWEKWWEAINFITQWWLKALMSKFLPSNIWLKTMNSLEIEKHLVRNLKIIEKAEALINNGASVSQIQKVLWNLAKPVVGGLSAEVATYK